MTRKPEILLTQPLDESSERRLRAAAHVLTPASLEEAELCRCVAECDAMIVRTGAALTRRVLEAGRHLRVIGVAAAGLDHVDLDAAESLGIRVLHKPEAASDAVAEFTVALMLQLLRPTPRLAARYRSGDFVDARRLPHGDELHSLTVGIVGIGRIGSRVARICAAGFGAAVIYNDIAEMTPFPFKVRAVDKSEIWSTADIISLHVPLTNLTHRLVSADVFRAFRPNALLLNTARGRLVDTRALLDALCGARIGGAALDVTDPEPLPPDHPLWNCGNCILTPHVASRTHSGLGNMFSIAGDVLAYLQHSRDDVPDVNSTGIPSAK